MVAPSGACRRVKRVVYGVQYWQSLWSRHIDSLTVRRLHLVVLNLVSALLETVDIHRIDLHDDDHIEVHPFLTRKVPLFVANVSLHDLSRS